MKDVDGSGILTAVTASVAALLLTTTAAAQVRPDGHISLFLDRVPNASAAVELRTRLFVEETFEPSPRVKVVLSGYAEGLIAERGGRARTDAFARPQDAYVELVSARFDLRAGMSRLVWGRLDELQPSDVVNPIDVSRFFFEGRNEARLPVALVRARVFFSRDAALEAVYVPVFRRGRFDQLDEPTAPFNLTPDAAVCRQTGLCPDGRVRRRQPDVSLGHAQGGLRLSATTGRVDWAMAAYRGFESFGLFDVELGPQPSIVQRFPRFTMLAGDFETVRGAWGLRGEVAAFVRDSFQSTSGPAVVEGNSIDIGGGLDRRAGEYRLSGTVLLHREKGASPLPDSNTDLSLIASAERSFARERYRVRAFAVYNAVEHTSFVRGIGTTNVRDDVSLEASAGLFGGEGRDALGRFAQRDFLYARLKVFF
ncbi:MAG: hypothetical protein LC804_27965 [Acidobacteria bacterium]|nr:hypothetical protein [Acidobacteriota bacterium]